MTKTLTYTKELIKRKSITPNDAGCQDWLAKQLTALGFHNEPMPFGDVKNLYSKLYSETDRPIFVFAGHTDVVPTGDLKYWNTPPFMPTEQDGVLYGRGSADMKSSIAAMLRAYELFLSDNPIPKINLGFLITSDEEGIATDGTIKVVQALENRNEKIDWCLIGEPTAVDTVGDTVKNGRRGSLNGKLIVKGIQGHIAYPHLSKNPIHLASEALAKLTKIKWDSGNKFFPPTTMQISNINAGTGATNVTPGEMTVLFNFRFSTESTAAQLQQKFEVILNNYQLDYEIDWNLSGEPFLTKAGNLILATQFAVQQVRGFKTKLSTSGGTSDGRFIAPTGAEVLECGPVNASIHQTNENININELEQLTKIYLKILNFLNQKST